MKEKKPQDYGSIPLKPESIVKEVKIATDGKQLFVRIPKEVSDFLKISKGNRFVFIVKQPTPSSPEVANSFEIKRGVEEKIALGPNGSIYEKVDFKPYERTIFDVLYRAGRQLTTKQVSEKGRMNWSTASKYLNSLHGKGWLDRKELANRTYWSIVPKSSTD